MECESCLPTSPFLQGEEKARLLDLGSGQRSSAGGQVRIRLIDMFCSTCTGFLKTWICCRYLKTERFFFKSKFLPSLKNPWIWQHWAIVPTQQFLYGENSVAASPVRVGLLCGSPAERDGEDTCVCMHVVGECMHVEEQEEMIFKNPTSFQKRHNSEQHLYYQSAQKNNFIGMCYKPRKEQRNRDHLISFKWPWGYKHSPTPQFPSTSPVCIFLQRSITVPFIIACHIFQPTQGKLIKDIHCILNLR